MSDEPYTVIHPQYVRLGAVLIALETSKSIKEAIRAVHDLKVETFPAAIVAEVKEAEVRGAKAERERMIASVRDEARSTPMDKRVEISEALVRKCDLLWHAYDVIRDIDPAAIVAERGAGTTGELDLDMPIESDTYDPPEAAPAPVCARCGGSGEIPAIVSFCPECESRSFTRDHGTVECDRCSWWMVATDPCPACGGKP